MNFYPPTGLLDYWSLSTADRTKALQCLFPSYRGYSSHLPGS
ncbi:MAG: hypothetical protein DBX04_00725 [Candidatus Poseidoniales archaeon]|nr:MAG: hypothetical protein DBX04_01325 [Candidatus Poseidoniales archaeon]RCH77342.1 MAG: hypothetical protein DBX04_00725 [Candidatus Poseidoniales archaeon]